MVEIRPVDKSKWHGKKDKESFAQPIVIEALIDANTGKFATGLTPEQEAKYSKEMGVDLSPVFTGQPHPFWNSKAAWVYLPNRTLVLDPQKPHEFVKIAVCKASKYVANSLKEYEANQFPDATHIIYDEEQEVEVKALSTSQKQDAYSMLSKMTGDDKANVLHILTGKSARGKSDNYLNAKIGTEIEANAAEFTRVASMGKEEVSNRAKVLELQFKNILTKEVGGGIYYMGQQIAANFEDAVAWFKDPNNQRMKISIMEKLNVS